MIYEYPLELVLVLSRGKNLNLGQKTDNIYSLTYLNFDSRIKDYDYHSRICELSFLRILKSNSANIKSKGFNKLISYTLNYYLVK